MKKSVYSIVLSDNIVTQIDRLAYQNGTNRSEMINRILAEYISYETPEMKLRGIFDGISNILSSVDSFKLMSDATDTVMSLRSPIIYKYNPSIKYSIELFKVTSGESVGEFRAVIRTQNAALISYFEQFCTIFNSIENKYGISVPSQICDRKFTRLIVPRNNPNSFHSNEEKPLGDIIGNYVYMFDNCLKAYFASNDNIPTYYPQMIKLYSDYLKGNSVII